MLHYQLDTDLSLYVYLDYYKGEIQSTVFQKANVIKLPIQLLQTTMREFDYDSTSSYNLSQPVNQSTSQPFSFVLWLSYNTIITTSTSIGRQLHYIRDLALKRARWTMKVFHNNHMCHPWFIIINLVLTWIIMISILDVNTRWFNHVFIHPDFAYLPFYHIANQLYKSVRMNFRSMHVSLSWDECTYEEVPPRVCLFMSMVMSLSQFLSSCD